MAEKRSVFKNKTIFRNLSDYPSDNERCIYIWYAINKTEEIFKKFGKFESNYHDDNEKSLFRYLKALSDIKPYIDNLTNIKQQIYTHQNIIIDMIMKAIKNQYKGSLSKDYCDKYEFFLNQCMNLDTYFSNNMIMDLFSKAGVRVDSSEYDYVLLSTWNDVRSHLNSAKRYSEIAIVRMYNKIYFEISDEYDDSHLFAQHLSDYSQELIKIVDTELYKAILLDSNDDGDYHNMYSKDPKYWTHEERLEFDKHLYEGYANKIANDTKTYEVPPENTTSYDISVTLKDESSCEVIRPDPRGFPTPINPWDPDEMKKQLKDTYINEPNVPEKLDLSNQEIIDSVSEIAKDILDDAAKDDQQEADYSHSSFGKEK